MSENQTAVENQESQGKKKRNFGPKKPPTIDVKDVLKMLEEGKTREDIGEHYGGLNQGQIKELFSHPKLKGKKTLRRASNAFILQDTSGDDVPVYQEPVKAAGTTGSNGSGQAQAEAQPQAQPQPVAGAWD